MRKLTLIVDSYCKKRFNNELKVQTSEHRIRSFSGEKALNFTLQLNN